MTKGTIAGGAFATMVVFLALGAVRWALEQDATPPPRNVARKDPLDRGGP